MRGSMDRGDSGAAAVQFLAALLFLSAVVIGAGFFLSSMAGMQKRHTDTNTVMREMDEMIQTVVEELMNDPTPEIHSRDDSVWAWHEKTENGYTVTITPLSDRINPNFVRKNLFERTSLSSLFKSGRNADELQQFREDEGLSLSPEGYADFFDEALFESCFSCYGWANINLVDEFAVRSLALALTGSEYTAEGMRNKIQTLLIDRQLVNRNGLRAALAGDYEDLFPFINAEPLMNVNFIEPLILREIIAYPDYGITSPHVRAQELLNLREGGGVSESVIRNITGADETNRLYYYLGSVTWFWEISVEGKNRSCRAVVCRIPPEGMDAGQPPEYSIIEQRFE